MKHSSISRTSLIFAIIGVVFGSVFQSMAYWDNQKTMLWYWIGAILGYIFSILAIYFLISLKSKSIKTTNIDFAFILISILLILGNILWITFVIIAWHPNGF